MCSKLIGEHASVISIKSQSTLRYGCSPVNLLHIFRTRFPNNTFEELRPKARFSKRGGQIFSNIFSSNSEM